ncbi:hypothetical protein [Mesorhizobium sp. NPDC059025]|uniref:hypothetical protein n=1 Tax=unclassified Mesorhizobium TaxID=325217 RepID=UPI0036939908
MARRNFKRLTASLRAFLQTGELAPITPGLTLLDVAALIGPPAWWVTDCHDFPVPLHWGYSTLEISFSLEPPHPIESLAIKPPHKWGSRFHSFCPLLRLSMDGISMEGRPSDLLRAGIWNLDSIEVGILIDPENSKLCIRGSGIEVLYVVPDLDTQHHSQPGEVESAIALLEEHAFLHGLYQSHGSISNVRWPEESWQEISAREYLETMERSQRAGVHGLC